jgi:biopolymer transport protein ExbB
VIGFVAEAPTYVAAGGVLMAPLFFLAFLLWFLIALRILNLRLDVRGALVRAGDGRPLTRERLDLISMEIASRLRRHRRAIRAITAVAPLIGLLGTVRGMIGTFESMAGVGFTHAGGVAGGISEALVTTQVGLAVAIPGLLVGRLLERREARLRAELDRAWRQASRR